MNREFFRPLLGIALATAMGSASSAQEPERAAPGTVRVVGVVNDIESKVSHTHVGKTVFGTFRHEFDSDWDIPGLVERHLAQMLEAQGVDVKKVELTADERKLVSGKGCHTWTGKFRPRCSAPVQVLLDRLDVDALVDLQTYSAIEEGFSEKGPVKGYGVFTVGLGDSKDTTVHANIRMQAYAGNPGRMLDTQFCRKAETGDHPFGKPIGQVVLDDLMWIKPDLEALVQQGIENSLKASGLIPGEPTPCDY